MPAPIVEVNDLRRSYGSVEVVRGISFTVGEGEVFGLLGPNGAGKTTTLETIEGLRTIQHGSVRVNGIDVAREPARVRRSIGIQLQRVAFFERLNLEELLRLFGELYETTVDPLALLRKVDLLDHRRARAKTLSGGQLQRLNLAVALVNNPHLVFLDEPSAGLDPHARRALWDMVLDIKAAGKSVILTTHYIEEAEALCDRVAILDQGEIRALNTPSKLIQDLLDTGFRRKAPPAAANLEDVFLNLTGRGIE
jgi:ABC-2 type transport system ATP-binding protein